jgi:hypothetical protein
MVIDASGFGGTGYNLTAVSVTVSNSTTFTFPSTGSDETTTADVSGRITARKDFTVLSVKGFDPIDDLEDYPDLLHPIIDGSLIPQNIGNRRHFSIELSAISMQTYTNRLFIGNFWKDPVKLITYTHDSITETDLDVVKEDGAKLESEWIGGSSLGRALTLKLQDQYLITSFPA